MFDGLQTSKCQSGVDHISFEFRVLSYGFQVVPLGQKLETRNLKLETNSLPKKPLFPFRLRESELRDGSDTG